MKEFIKYLEASVEQTSSDYKKTKSDYSKGKNYAYFEALKVVKKLTIPVVVDSSVTISKQEYDDLKRDSDDLQKVSFSM